MDLPGGKGIWLEKIAALRKRLLKRDVAVFSFFLLLSFIFWFLNALGKESTGKLKYPVRYINFPDKMALVNELPDVLTLTVTGPGYNILQTKLSGRREHLTIDLDKAGLRPKNSGDKLKFHLLSFGLRGMLSSQVRGNFTVNAVLPDTINFVFDRVANKKVPVVPDIELTTQRQYFVYGDIECYPDSITISGPAVIVDTIDSVKTKYYQFTQLKEDVSKNISLEPIQKISYSERRVTMTIPVEQFTEAVLNLPIKINSMPDTVNVRLFPDKVTMHCIVALSDYNSINEALIDAVVDLHEVDINTANRLRVVPYNVPGYASQVRLNPEFVEFLIERKQ